MATKKKMTTADDAEVSAFIAALAPPLRAEVEALRRLIRSVSNEVEEGVKWNAPSFRTSEWFATMNLRDGLKLVLHRGVQKRSGAVEIDDPEGLLSWRGDERAVVTFEDGVAPVKSALKAVLKQWLAALSRAR